MLFHLDGFLQMLFKYRSCFLYYKGVMLSHVNKEEQTDDTSEPTVASQGGADDERTQ